MTERMKTLAVAGFMMATLATATPPGRADAAPGSLLAKATTEQLTAAAKALNSAPAALRADADAAMPTLRPYLITLMCVQDDSATVALVRTYIGSRGTTMFNGWSGAASPAKRMPHHDMVGCLTVTRIQNWRRIAANEFGFDILFTAEDSGESYLWPTKVHREPDGTWLIA
ncbi:MAG TPA: hypothetical protein VNJ10_06305 [Sphingomonas sp.]|nr:hypothetical protein [Sphingomonas sp.]